MAKPEKKDEWLNFPLEDYAAVAGKMVHFSFKSVNSNVAGGGVRLGADEGLSLPYVSARTLLGQGTPLDVDYVKQSGNVAKVAKQIRKVLSNEIPGTAGEPLVGLQDIQTICQTIKTTHHEVGCKTISPRMRQLLLPRDESYLAVSPMGAAGLNKIIKQKIEGHNESHKANKESPTQTRLIHSAIFGIGGSNTQNVGALIRDMQCPLYFRAPKESLRFKMALSLYYKGIPLRLPQKLTRDFYEWRISMKRKNGGTMPTNLAAQEEAKVFVRCIIVAVLSRGEKALGHMKKEDIQKSLPNEGVPLVSPQVDPIIRGVIDPALREPDWAYRLGWKMAEQFASYEFRDSVGRVEATFNLDNEHIALLAKWIKEIVR